MKSKHFNIFILFKICISLTYAVDPPPNIEGSYHAITEVSWVTKEEDYVIMMSEENFDLKTKRSSFTLYDDSMNVTIYEDMMLNQSLIYDAEGCRAYKPKEWLKVHGPPDLEMYEIGENKIFFPLMQLFWGLRPNNLKPGTDRTLVTYRDVSAQKWTYLLNYQSSDKKFKHTIEIDAFWSDGEAFGPSKEPLRPLGYAFRRTSVNLTSRLEEKYNYSINIFYFLQNVFNKNALQVKQGIHCTNRITGRPFPNFMNFEAFSVNIEYLSPKSRMFGTVDMWVDGKNKLVQIRLDPLNQEVQPHQKKQTKIRIASNEQQIIYDIDPENYKKCKIMPIREMPFDEQTLYDFDLLSKLDLQHFFGKVPYIYMGESVKRGIPCRLWQGVRRQWPSEPQYSSVTTLWEWCIAERTVNPVMFQANTLPVVSLDITVIESPLTSAESFFTLGQKLTYSFYNFNYRTSNYINTVAFDISQCFPPELIEPWRFKVKLNTKSKTILSNLTIDADFIGAWKEAIYSASSLEPSSLRITRVRTVIVESELFIEFYILNLHPGLPTTVNDNIKSSVAIKTLENFINTGSLAVIWQKNVTQPLTLTAVKYSLTRQYEKLKPPPPTSVTSINTEPTKQETETTEYTLTGDVIIIGSTKGRHSTTLTPTSRTIKPTPTKKIVTERPKIKDRLTGHSKGTMAALSVGMLLFGMSLGAGGTFVKFRYFKR
ncbi:uncharacterized protein LOC111624941 [Centruroides sculpturatus]|uniref:uncharacterized protein LOC111624941 n=1 Tax=Centruroides sculpturatus TaxID=218467 RepID=UPI000C6DA5A2|nr:uncharacterized protein LOC111624941 [Centruroides sculpturatus]